MTLEALICGSCSAPRTTVLVESESETICSIIPFRYVPVESADLHVGASRAIDEGAESSCVAVATTNSSGIVDQKWNRVFRLFRCK